MGLKITHRSFADGQVLEVEPSGVIFTEISAFAKKHKFPFGEIDCVLLSPTHALSFQAGGRTFTIPFDNAKTGDRAVLDALLTGLGAPLVDFSAP